MAARFTIQSDVYSAEEIAQAAGLPVSAVEALAADGGLRPVSPAHPFYDFQQAAAAVRRLKAERASGAFLFDHPSFQHASTQLPVAVSSTVHAAIAACVIFISGISLPQASATPDLTETRTHLVFLAMPGPGGGGGGGGLRQKAPPPRALRKGAQQADSPVPAREAPTPIEPIAHRDPPPAEPAPQVVTPVVAVASNDADREGVIDVPAPAQSDSRGPGSGGGFGSGDGTGLGSGDGAGIGPGSGGGTGGGPYRPGSGITPPQILREVKADYTEDARRRGIQGEVLLEIVVRRDGGVGDVRLIRGLDGGLNDRAITAVRQWRWEPARRLGQAVDVVVEVAVEFTLR